MRITNKVIIALLILMRLKNGTKIKRANLIVGLDTSISNFENILVSLKSSNIINTVRGAHGGCVINKPFDKISVYDVITSVEGENSFSGACERICDNPGKVLKFLKAIHRSDIERYKAITLYDINKWCTSEGLADRTVSKIYTGIIKI